MSNDSLGDRMKSYEDSYRISLPIRMPVILRIDGKAFHTYTRGCKKPFDQGLADCMNDTAKALCENIQGAKLAYVQSDEISILVNNYETIDTQPWFDNNLQKMVSISAAVASTTFTVNSYKIWAPKKVDPGMDPMSACDYNEVAHFDSRAFIVPKEDVCNYFLWRQQDATRNSIQMLARSMYSHKECENQNTSQLQEMIFRKGINWNDSPVSQKRGRCLVKVNYEHIGTNPITGETFPGIRSEWRVDNNIPIFSQDRQFIEKFV